MFSCDRQSPLSTATVKVLVGMRSGDVVELNVDFNRSYTTREDILDNKQLSED